MVPSQIKANIIKKTNDQLIKLLANRKEYSEYAINLAKNEIQARGVTNEYFRLKYKIYRDQAKEKNVRSKTNLTVSEILLIICWPILPILVILFYALMILGILINPPYMVNAKKFYRDGYKKKSSQAIAIYITSIFLWPILTIFTILNVP